MNHLESDSPSGQVNPETHPFVMFRHDFVSDQRLADADVRVLLALMYWARNGADCWPCVESIGWRVNKKERATRIALKNLEHFGYIRFERDSGKVTGRRIVLVWKADGSLGDTKEAASPREKIRERINSNRLKPGMPLKPTTTRKPIPEPEASDERRKELRRMPYADYLDTPEWARTKKRMLRRAHGRCQVCNGADTTLHVHHRDYSRRGNERNADLVVLCKECHQTFHENRVLAKA